MLMQDKVYKKNTIVKIEFEYLSSYNILSKINMISYIDKKLRLIYIHIMLQRLSEESFNRKLLFVLNNSCRLFFLYCVVEKGF